MRNSYKDAAYFEEQFKFDERNRDFATRMCSKPDLEEGARQRVLLRRYKEQIKSALWLYNVGCPIDDVVEALNTAWLYWIEMLDTSLNNSLGEASKVHIVPMDYIRYFPLLVLTDPPKDIAQRIFEFTNTELLYSVDSNTNKLVDIAFDGFFNHFVRYFDFTSEKTTLEILNVRVYGMLNACFTTTDKLERQKTLIDYVNGWSALAQDGLIYEKNGHKKSPYIGFQGYWCFLGAAVAKILNIDDSPLKDHPDYPYDLVHR